MSPRARGRFGAALLAGSVLTALFTFESVPVLVACGAGFAAGLFLVLSGMKAAVGQMEASQARIESLMQVELEKARREKAREGEQKGGGDR